MAKQSKLTQQILNDFFRAPHGQVGGQLPSLKELSEKYQSCNLTLRRVLNQLEAKGWLETRWGKGSFVKRLELDEAARSIGNHLTIGYVAGNLRLPLGMEFLEGLEAAAHRLDVGVMVANSHFSTEKEREHVYRLHERGAAGVVVIPTDRVDEHDWLGEELREFPVVVADLYRSAMNRSRVVFDNRTAGREITERLLAQGRRRIAFVGFGPLHNVASVNERQQGYALALQYAGLTVPPTFAPMEDATAPRERRRSATELEQYLYAELDRLMALDQAPDAIVFAYDILAKKGVSHLRKRGVKVPGTVLCAGFDNLQGERPDPWLTTRPDFRQLGERAAELLIDTIRTGSRTPVEVVLPCPVWLPPAVQIPHDAEFSTRSLDAFAPAPEPLVKAL